MRRVLTFAFVCLTVVLVPAAAAVGPSLPDVAGADGVVALSGDVRYVTALHASGTTVKALTRDGRLLRTARIAGRWGVPLVTLNGATGGLSASGRTLVLGDHTDPGGSPRGRSGFAVLDAGSLALERVIRLEGDFSFDALSPAGATLYLIQHVQRPNAWSYRVRAYDLSAGRLLRGVIADKSQSGWVMSGLPVARATSPGGRWVYTLYQESDNYPFVHALDTIRQRAVCVGLPWQWATSGEAIGSATLELAGGKLLVAAGAGSTTRFVLDLRTLRVMARGENITT